ncbi:MAG: hypothetical protein M3480_05285 [Verrucomicrobiota bacterium]|nr:hypothetical protein [Chthoniobacterales bacterium]MDQ3414375.1 hypothetical protein [Verrucomicrobiota bacterium]
MRSLGFRVFRVRHQVEAEGVCARLEIAPNEMPRLDALADSLLAQLRAVGYADAWIDPRGYRSPPL